MVGVVSEPRWALGVQGVVVSLGLAGDAYFACVASWGFLSAAWCHARMVRVEVCACAVTILGCLPVCHADICWVPILSAFAAQAVCVVGGHSADPAPLVVEVLHELL